MLQSGNVTPGHLAIWTTDGVIQDGGSRLGRNLLASIRGANFNSTFDQPIVMPPAVTAFQLTGIIVTNASTSLSAAVGGFYTQAFKAGSALVAAGQVYSALTGADLLLNTTLTAFANTARLSTDNLPLTLNAGSQYGLTMFLSLTTPQGTAATADVYFLGNDLS